MLRQKVSIGKITRYMFCAECVDEEDIYLDNNYLLNNVDIKNSEQFAVLIFVTENLEINQVTKTKEFLLDKSYRKEGYKKLTEYLANKNSEKVFLYYKVLTFENLNDILCQCGHGNFIVFIKKDSIENTLNRICEIFTQEKYIILYESSGDKIFSLYNKLIAVNSIKYIMHYTSYCQIGVGDFANSTLPVNSFDLIDTMN